MDKMKLMMDEFGLHSQSKTSCVPDLLYSNFCPIEIVVLSEGRSTLQQNVKEIYGWCNTPVITLACFSLSAALFINPIQPADSYFPQCIILNAISFFFL